MPRSKKLDLGLKVKLFISLYAWFCIQFQVFLSLCQVSKCNTALETTLVSKDLQVLCSVVVVTALAAHCICTAKRCLCKGQRLKKTQFFSQNNSAGIATYPLLEEVKFMRFFSCCVSSHTHTPASDRKAKAHQKPVFKGLQSHF